MKIKDLSKAELEAMSYDDIAYMILSESKDKMKINDLFKKVCELLELPESVFVDKIADFFEVLSTDQRFTMLSEGYWDLKTRHSAKIIIDDEEDEDVLAEALEDEEEFESEEEEDIYYDNDETDDQAEDDLKDLVIIDEEDEANGLN